MSARNCATQNWQQTLNNEDGKLKSIQLKWDVEVLWLLPPSDCWKTLASMDRLCDRQLDQSLKQPKEAASGYGLSGRTIAGLKEHQHDPLANSPHSLPYLRTQVTTLKEEVKQGMRSALCMTQRRGRPLPCIVLWAAQLNNQAILMIEHGSSGLITL